MNPRDAFLRELFYNNAYSTDELGFRYYVVEAFSNVYSVRVWYTVETDEYTVVSWKNETN